MADTSPLVQALTVVLADTYTLYLQTQNFHWNVTGENFPQYHAMFEDQYDEYAEAIDVIAENIRMLGAKAPGTFGQFQELSTLHMQAEVTSAQAMIKTLVDQTEGVIKSLKAAEAIADELDQLDTEDLMVERLRAHSKFLWMLRSTAE